MNQSKTRKYKSKGGMKRGIETRNESNGNKTNEESEQTIRERVEAELRHRPRVRVRVNGKVNYHKGSISFMGKNITTYTTEENGFTVIEFEQSGSNIGNVVFKIIGDTFEIERLFVENEKRNQGWGKSFLYLLVNHAFSDKRINKVELEDRRGKLNTHGKNIENKLYEKFGFKKADPSREKILAQNRDIDYHKLLVLTKENYLENQGDIEAYVRAGTNL